MNAKNLFTKSLLSASVLIAANALTSNAFSQAAPTVIEFRSEAEPIVVAGSPMVLQEQYHTDTEMIGVFIAPAD